ncbi:MAG: hypothetical protein H0V64_05610 [Geodermatophilaceae bacterium]|nr:hypothetical protein [Geodermatophilaceae bacterium]MDQ3465297.1 hypothetical protein [Actinomycetota bacterium]
MRWPFPRREAPPASALAGLERDERVLAWATTGGETMVATTLGLWWTGGERIPWHLITHVVWSGSTLSVTSATEVEPSVLAAEPARSVRLTEPRTLPETVQQRFYGSRSHTARHRLPGGSGVIVVARRVPGQDGLTWYAVYDEPGQRHDPVVRAEVERLLDSARSP